MHDLPRTTSETVLPDQSFPVSVDAAVTRAVGSHLFDPLEYGTPSFAAEALAAVLAGAVRATLTETHSAKHTLQFEPEAAPEEGDEDMQVPQPPSLLVFSGGTAFNSVAGANMLQSNNNQLCSACLRTAVYMHTTYAQNSKKQCRNPAEFHNKGSSCAACL